jgi:hypothetical protein
MSGNNALAAAKRRRTSNPTDTVKPKMPPPSKNLNTKTQQSKTQLNKLGENNFTETENNEIPSLVKHFMLPKIPEDVQVNPLQLLNVHHKYLNRVCTILPNLTCTITDNVNLIATNCDNLNERLQAIEENQNQSFNSNNKEEINLLNSSISKMQSSILQINKNVNKMFNDINEKFAEQQVVISNLIEQLNLKNDDENKDEVEDNVEDSVENKTDDVEENNNNTENDNANN